MKFSSNLTFTLAQPSSPQLQGLSMTTKRWISCALLSLLACVSLVVSTNEADGEPRELFIFSEICALKKDDGPCKAIKDRFYFDIDTGHCELFEYGGCGGNENNFETLEECAETCLVSAEKSPCHLEEAPGPCRGLVTRYFYDSTSQECKHFFYGGCFGNANNFKSMSVCQAKCQNQGTTTPATNVVSVQPTNESSIQPLTRAVAFSQPQVHRRKSETDFSPPAICMTPVDRGTCDGAERRFAFNPKTDRCHVFRYCGVAERHGGGNANNFSHKRHCMKTCMNIRSGTKMIRIRKKNLNNISIRAI